MTMGTIHYFTLVNPHRLQPCILAAPQPRRQALARLGVSTAITEVSYKWHYLVSLNAAKRLLQEFVEKHENGFKVVYVLAGWLKSDPSSYHIRLVSGPKFTGDI
ncbi:eukaryotic translation initiation factor 5B-like [Pyrus ussuriensis x Pyrus communis]|uniref:DNA polymerase delta subunit 3 n=1 Tax=Pyrus ussuriensis x Pyrus communis TaxID=2448454 RepID=A0A5N5HTC4_9ROSA|nr:eukaryotic translation initiation factor 5B-like [Pyrus ussuriensis x Pyrus communis]